MCLCQRWKLSEGRSYLSRPRPSTIRRTQTRTLYVPCFSCSAPCAENMKPQRPSFSLEASLRFASPKDKHVGSQAYLSSATLGYLPPVCQTASFLPGKFSGRMFIPCSCLPDSIGTFLFLGHFLVTLTSFCISCHTIWLLISTHKCQCPQFQQMIMLHWILFCLLTSLHSQMRCWCPRQPKAPYLAFSA